MEKTINFLVNGVCSCVVVIAGVILNSVSIYIIWKRYGRINIFPEMLICLLFFDICVVVTWMNLSLYIGFNLRNNVIVHMVPYFSIPSTHIAITASTFMTVAIAHERYLAVQHPWKYGHVEILSRQDTLTPNIQSNRLKLYLCIVIVISIAFNIPRLMAYKVRYVDLSNNTNSTYSNSTDALLKPVLVYTALGKHPYYLKYYKNCTRLIVSGIVPLVLLIFYNVSMYKLSLIHI